MMIGERLRTLREQKNLSQADIEKRTGLQRSYISRVETGHITPSIDTLERMSGADLDPSRRILVLARAGFVPFVEGQKEKPGKRDWAWLLRN
jgi:transcriptional regulator with XRE-family HTH domain